MFINNNKILEFKMSSANIDPISRFRTALEGELVTAMSHSSAGQGIPENQLKKIKIASQQLAGELNYTMLTGNGVSPRIQREVELLLLNADLITNQLDDDNCLKAFTVFTGNLSSSLENQPLKVIYEARNNTSYEISRNLHKLALLKDKKPEIYADIHGQLTILKADFLSKCDVVELKVELTKLQNMAQKINDGKALNEVTSKFNTLKAKFESLDTKHFARNGEYSRNTCFDQFDFISVILRSKTGNDDIVSPPARKAAPLVVAGKPPLASVPPAQQFRVPVVDRLIQRDLDQVASAIKEINKLQKELGSNVSVSRINEISLIIDQLGNKIQETVDRLAPYYIGQFKGLISLLEEIKRELGTFQIDKKRIGELKSNLGLCNDRVSNIINDLNRLGNSFLKEDYDQLTSQERNAEQLINDLSRDIRNREKMIAVGSCCESCCGYMGTAAAKVYNVVGNFLTGQYFSDRRGLSRAIADIGMVNAGKALWSDPENYVVPVAFGAGFLAMRIADSRHQPAAVPQSRSNAAPLNQADPAAQPQPQQVRGSLLIRPERQLAAENPLALGGLAQPPRAPFFAPGNRPVPLNEPVLRKPPAAMQQGEADPFVAENVSSDQPGLEWHQAAPVQMRVLRPIERSEEKKEAAPAAPRRDKSRRRARVDMTVADVRGRPDLFGEDSDLVDRPVAFPNILRNRRDSDSD